ncbi:cell division protein FtsQ/DivIB [Chlorogloea sp. CCALA 695]|uniref:cell division protein FtsQ/DivIB n=1 Tax=Chlorogloea sp. CCALA 695 TaxID=2107693 RepID=UPI000D07A687|nr:FtsQ-type POTRA domain-containing protein [Chlorogloea sp. CCALA 695]PSB34170.1 cell division protein FtsQ [Chlorogloea sp. CCALA 695]
MNNLASVSPGELTQRRSVLRRNRRIKQIKSVWRTLAISGLLGGLVWGATQPVWVIRESGQINVIENQLLTTPAIQSLLKISYPQTLLEIKPEALAQQLEAQPTISDAKVTRSLFPPSLTVQVTERIPVAVALTKNLTPGLIAADGVWIPQQSYAAPNSTSFKMPKLKVRGQVEAYKPYWSQLYQAVNSLEVKVSEIDWQNSDNLILKTELGIIHLGAYSSKLSDQLRRLEEMRRLPTKVNPQDVAYIDLTNPKDPFVQMTSESLQRDKLAKKTDPRP